MPDAVAVQRMFREIAPRYDLVNRVLSLGIDASWRRKAVAFAGAGAGTRALDVCAGTGDLSFALADAGASVTSSDFCKEMLGLAQAKRRRRGGAGDPRIVCSDTLALPFADQRFDLATVAFGIRNVADPLQGLVELRRVVRPGGRVVVLEFCRPRVPALRSLYSFYFRRVLPRLGRWLSGERVGAYAYLPDSVMAFPEREGFLALMRRAGLESPTCKLLTLGIAALYRADIPR